MKEITSIEEKLLRKAGLFKTPRRVRILEIFRERAENKNGLPKHLTAEDLYEILNEEGLSASLGTIYRALAAFSDKHILKQLTIRGGRAFYEWSFEREHHDHLFCTDCSTIEEFSDEVLENLQHKVARRHGFELTGHVMVLYGSCKGCVSRREEFDKKD